MKLTKESQLLMSFFHKNNCVNTIDNNAQTNIIFANLYEDIHEAHEFVSQQSQQSISKHLKHITNIGQITKPATFPESGFPEKILSHINTHTISEIHYEINMFNKTYNVYFLITNVSSTTDKKLQVYDNYVTEILVWITILNKYAPQNCRNNGLSLYLYFTNLKKELPNNASIMLDEHHINTAFTYSCPNIPEIVVFRKEEWFKVFIHETFHNFGLDFSMMNMTKSNKFVRSIFNVVKSDINLFEAYTEFWAKIINICFCSYKTMHNKTDLDEYLDLAETFVNVERTHLYFQAIKVLDFMSLNYSMLTSDDTNISNSTKDKYKEDTSVLSYYIICLVLFNDYQRFLKWCLTNNSNSNLFLFKRTPQNLTKFCKYIKDNYKMHEFLHNISCTEEILRRMKAKPSKYSFYLTNLRMTLCELG